MSVTKCKTIAVQDGVDALTSFVREVHCAGSCLQIKQLYVGDVGCVVWDAALVLAKFLENPIHFPPPSCESLGFWKGKRVIDIGAGTGIVGLAAGVLGADVWLTDLPVLVDLMNSNISLNSAVLVGKVTARELTWSTNLSDDVMNFQPEVILMSDVIYYEESLQDLVATLVSVSNHGTTVIMTYEERDTGNKPEIEKRFFIMMERHFRRTDVDFQDLDELMRSTDIHIVKFNLQ